MPDYRRPALQGGAYFFTVVTYRRQTFLCHPDVRVALRAGIRTVQADHPFAIDAWVLLPDHLHCIWQLPTGDVEFAKRWAMIKRAVTKRCGARLHQEEWMSASRRQRHESTLWQRRFWEHVIRNDTDLNRHRDYIHWNPVKHGYVKQVKDWPFSTFHRFVKRGMYSADWGGIADDVDECDFGE